MMPNRSWLSLVLATANFIEVSGFHRFPTSFVSHPSTFAILDASNRRRLSAFIENGNEMNDSSTSTRGNAAGMSSLKDAEAYNDVVSAAVDFTSIYLRNGIVTGEIVAFCSREASFLCFPFAPNIMRLLPLFVHLPYVSD
jgi:hypothetical protein